MGTRALTRIFDENGGFIMSLYRQFDGYPSGHGDELAKFLSSLKITEGFRSADRSGLANGMGCLAAQIVASFKVEAGGFYLVSSEHYHSTDYKADYCYDIYVDDTSTICMTVKVLCSRVIYDGPVSEFDSEKLIED